jgi:hypothetical protein
MVEEKREEWARERRRKWVLSAHTPFLRHMGRASENGEAKSVLRWRRFASATMSSYIPFWEMKHSLEIALGARSSRRDDGDFFWWMTHQKDRKRISVFGSIVIMGLAHEAI